MATFVVAHGAWSAGWAWKKMHPLMRAVGHMLYTPTCTGLGERGHLASPSVDLDLHIRDIVAVLTTEDLANVILIGHSYGGMVATGVADRARAHIAKLVYLDAFVPQDGQCLIDLLPAGARGNMLDRAKTGEGWKIAPNPMPSDTSPEDQAWAMPRRLPQPIRTFTSPLRLTRGAPPRTFIYCKRVGPGDVFRSFAERARNQDGWAYFEMDASHNPHITAPEALMAILQRIAAE